MRPAPCRGVRWYRSILADRWVEAVRPPATLLHLRAQEEGR